jgi:hypothetical protein
MMIARFAGLGFTDRFCRIFVGRADLAVNGGFGFADTLDSGDGLVAYNSGVMAAYSADFADKFRLLITIVTRT